MDSAQSIGASPEHVRDVIFFTLIFFEAAALVMLIALWIRPKCGLAKRIGLSLLLLVPIFGLVIFSFVTRGAPEYSNDGTDGGASEGGGAGTGV